MFLAHEACASQDMLCFATLSDATTITMYTDLTSAFPVRTFKNMQNIFIAYIYDLNAIIICPMPSRIDISFIAAFTKMLNTYFTGSGLSTGAKRHGQQMLQSGQEAHPSQQDDNPISPFA